MPELPEVETTRQGIKPFIEGQKITLTIIRHRGMRWPVPEHLEKTLALQTVHGVNRRAKYLLLQCDTGILILHLGMSGRMRVLAEPHPAEKHDHMDIQFSNGQLLRFTDPRRFGAILWTSDPIEQHPLIKNLGPEPFDDEFNAQYLATQAKGRTVSIKNFIMNGNIVVGVGNIYANEALFLIGVHPTIAAGKISVSKLEKLCDAIKLVLQKAINAGGSSLRDFRGADGKPGYFVQELNVYGRADQACINCKTPINCIRHGQRATYFCPVCQPK